MGEGEVLQLFVQIALAIKHIHDRKILHRDLKPGVIFSWMHIYACIYPYVCICIYRYYDMYIYIDMCCWIYMHEHKEEWTYLSIPLNGTNTIIHADDKRFNSRIFVHEYRYVTCEAWNWIVLLQSSTSAALLLQISPHHCLFLSYQCLYLLLLP